MIEIKITVKGDDLTVSEKYLVHEEGIILSHDCPQLGKMVHDTIAKFKGTVEDVLVKIKYTW